MSNLIVHLNIPHNKLVKLAQGKRVLLDQSELSSGSHAIAVNPSTYKKIHTNKANNKGMRLGLSQDEIMASGSLFDFLKKGAKWLGTSALDGVNTAANEAVPGLAPVFNGIRSGVKSLTGLGVKQKRTNTGKGTQEMKDRMAKVRAAKGKKKQAGGSFLLY
jgi:hypothetical protein